MNRKVRLIYVQLSIEINHKINHFETGENIVTGQLERVLFEHEDTIITDRQKLKQSWATLKWHYVRKCTEFPRRRTLNQRQKQTPEYLECLASDACPHFTAYQPVLFSPFQGQSQPGAGAVFIGLVSSNRTRGWGWGWGCCEVGWTKIFYHWPVLF